MWNLTRLPAGAKDSTLGGFRAWRDIYASGVRFDAICLAHGRVTICEGSKLLRAGLYTLWWNRRRKLYIFSKNCKRSAADLQ